jgi:Protein of unknown function (DUF1552)
VDAWTSSGKGADFKLGHIVAPLEPLKKYVTTFENIENLAAGGSVHTLNPATWLSCVRPDTAAKEASMAITLDQVIAQRLGQKTVLPSLEVASETTIQVAACGGAGCYYASTTSYGGPNSPLPMEYNPRKVFIQLMGEGDTAAERETLLRKNTSILDMIAGRAQSLRNELGKGDQAVLSDYLDSVREIERRVTMAGTRNLTGVSVPDAPVGELESFDKQVRLMFDLIALAYQADLTRIASYVMVAEGTNRTYNHVGVPDSFHPVSHHSNDRERIRRLTIIQRYHMERFADFLQKLAKTPDGDGNQHNNYPLPEILVGGANGAHIGGKNVVLAERTPLASLHLTMLDKLGIKQASFANSNGLLSEV